MCLSTVNAPTRRFFERTETHRSELRTQAKQTAPRVIGEPVSRGIGERGRPVRIGGERIIPGDYLVADADGVYTDVATNVGVEETKPTKGTVAFDADRDGKTDLFVTRDADTPLFFHNVTPKVGAWLDVKVTGRESEINGTGAIVTLKATPTSPVRKSFVGTIGSFLTADSRLIRFGLDVLAAPIHEVRVDFPATGKFVVLNDVDANRVLEVVEP